MTPLDELIDTALDEIRAKANSMVNQSHLLPKSLDRDRLILYNRAMGMGEAAIIVNDVLVDWTEENEDEI